MYARYIPPSKPGIPSTKVAEVPPPSNRKSPSPPPIQTTNSLFSYARWVPQAKTKPARAESQAAEAVASSSEREQQKRKRDEEETAPKSAGTKKSKNTKASTADAGQGSITTAPEAPRETSGGRREAKKKSRKDKKRRTTVDTDGESEADGSRTRTPPGVSAGEAPKRDIHIASEKKSRQKKRAARDCVDTGDTEEPAIDMAEEALKSKRDKERKKETKSKTGSDTNAATSGTGGLEAVGHVEEDAPLELVDMDAAGQAEEEDTTEPRKKRRRMKEKKQQQQQQQQQHEQGDRKPDGDEGDARHKSVLDKQRRSLKLAREAAESKSAEVAVDEAADEHDAPETAPIHSIGPLPQPEPVLPDTSLPTYATLPPWLSSPINVSQGARAPFTELGIPEKVQASLAAKGFPEAFAVQTAAIPLLIPSSRTHPNDVLIAAATGSGKTLAYALPVIRDVSTGRVTRLRALVVLPTRELVTQAREVLEMCAAAWAEVGGHKRAKIGISIGNQVLRQEQDALVERSMRYDTAAARRRRLRKGSATRCDAASDSLCESDGTEFDDILPDHVWEHASKVDVLICTPGRLVEHMEQTPGFTLDFVRWLVIDEADKILSQSFQGWLEMIMPAVQSMAVPGARDFPGCNVTGVRKVLLSATLTRDLGLLGPLRLRRPGLVVLEGAGATMEHVLPDGLSEMAVRVKDGAIKPLYLVQLLQGPHLLSLAGEGAKEGAGPPDSGSETPSSSGSDSDDSDSDSDSDSDLDPGTAARSESGTPFHATFPTTALIFTKSNEAALRLSRLLALLLAPTLASTIGTLTSSTPTATRRRILRAFTSRKTRILIASDLVARGIDFPSLHHVINYDLPASVAGYVHRVGRTARAGRDGKAWTLVDDTESGWFWGKIGKSGSTGKDGVIRRKIPVQRVKVGDVHGNKAFDGETIDAYERALEQVGAEAQEGRRKRR